MASIREVDYEEGFLLLDLSTRRELGIGASDFLYRYDRGEYAGTELAVSSEMLIPFARPVRAD